MAFEGLEGKKVEMASVGGRGVSGKVGGWAHYKAFKRPLGPSVSCRLERLAVRVSHLIRTLKGHMGGMASSKCLKTRRDVFANFQWVHFARLIIQPNVLEQVWMQNTKKKKKSSIVTSTVVRTEQQPASVHTEGQFGPDSAPPRPCPSGWAAWCWRWHCCRPNRADCRSCFPATSSGSGRESPVSRGRLSSWPGWDEAGGQTPASWVSPAGWWGGDAPGRGSVERGLYADEGPGRGWRGRGGEGCPGCPVHLKRKGMQKTCFNSILFHSIHISLFFFVCLSFFCVCVTLGHTDCHRVLLPNSPLFSVLFVCVLGLITCLSYFTK